MNFISINHRENNYEKFSHEYGQEHLQYLSREYMLPPVIIKDVYQDTYTPHSGTYNPFNSQMFTVSFCCHSKNDIRLQWYVNGRNMRMPSRKNFTNIWPEFFEEGQRSDEIIQKITRLLVNWKLPIKNKEYAAYEKDLLRFEKSNRGNKSENAPKSSKIENH